LSSACPAVEAHHAATNATDAHGSADAHHRRLSSSATAAAICDDTQRPIPHPHIYMSLLFLFFA
jgi:hypothetical protein